MASTADILIPHPDDRAAFVEDPALDASILLTPEQTTAYLHWLETGEGECPLPDGFG